MYPTQSHTLGVEMVKKKETKPSNYVTRIRCILSVTVTKCPFSEAPPPGPSLHRFVRGERDERKRQGNESERLFWSSSDGARE